MRGTDISAFQSSSTPAGDFCIIKATEGLDYVSSRYVAQLEDARRKGQLVGHYHFGHPKNDPIIECEHFYATIRSRLKPGELVVLDHEEDDGTSAAHCSSWAQKFLAHLELRVGSRPVVYTYLNFALEGRCAGLGKYPLWIADPSRAAGHPRVPAPWKNWVLHQYSSAGGLDRDVFNGDAATWRALASGITPPLEEDVYGGLIPAGKGQQVNISFPRGHLGAVGFFIDNTAAISGVIEPQPQAHLRLALHSYTGGWQIEDVIVGRGPSDDKTVKKVVTFKNKANVDAATVVRLDDGTTPVGWDMS